MASSGLGGAWLSRALLPYQPYFLATAWFAVALAWVIAIRRGWASYSLLALSTLIVGLATAWERLEPAALAALMRLTEGAA